MLFIRKIRNKFKIESTDKLVIWLGLTPMAVLGISAILFNITGYEIFGYMMLIASFPLLIFGYPALLSLLENTAKALFPKYFD